MIKRKTKKIKLKAEGLAVHQKITQIKIDSRFPSDSVGLKKEVSSFSQNFQPIFESNEIIGYSNEINSNEIIQISIFVDHGISVRIFEGLF